MRWTSAAACRSRSFRRGIALQNPELVGGELFAVLPDHDRIVIMLDADGDENYQPHVIPLAGGFPEPLNDEFFGGLRSHMTTVDDETATGYFFSESREQALIYGVRADLSTGDAETLGEGPYGPFPFTWTKDHGRVVLGDGYTAGDAVLYERDGDTKRDLWGRCSRIARRASSIRSPGSARCTSRTRSRACSSRRRCSRTRAARATSTSRRRARSARSRWRGSCTRAWASSSGS